LEEELPKVNEESEAQADRDDSVDEEEEEETKKKEIEKLDIPEPFRLDELRISAP
jgi:hypothetical protein